MAISTYLDDHLALSEKSANPFALFPVVDGERWQGGIHCPLEQEHPVADVMHLWTGYGDLELHFLSLPFYQSFLFQTGYGC